MQESVVSKDGMARQTTPRVNVITTGNSIVVLVLAGGELGFSSYHCPVNAKVVANTAQVKY